MPQSSPLWKNAELVMPMKPHEIIVGDAVRLGDFGLTIKAGTPVKPSVQFPIDYCAPEWFHGKMPTFATDMWSYFCIFAELYLGRPLISGPGNTYIVNHIVDTFGPLPESWEGSYVVGGSCQASWYDPQRRPRPELALDMMLSMHRPDISKMEEQHVLRILQRGFSYIPERRFTASQLLRDPSFKALMEIYGL